MHNPSVMVHYLPSSQPDEWGNVQVNSYHQFGLQSLKQALSVCYILNVNRGLELCSSLNALSGLALVRQTCYRCV